MKKVLVLLLSVLLICSVCTACSSAGSNEVAEEPSVSIDQGMPTDEAKIKDAEAINFIKNAYTEEELGLDKVKESYSLMVAGTGEEIDGKKYIKVAANVMSENDETNENGDKTFSINTVGVYYISYDGSVVLIRDMESGEFHELENRYKAYSESTEKNEPDTEKAK